MGGASLPRALGQQTGKGVDVAGRGRRSTGKAFRRGILLRARLHDGAQQVDEDRLPFRGHQDVAGRYVTVGRTVLMQVGQCRAQNVQERGQVGGTQPSPCPQDHVESRSFDEVHDDARTVLGQRHHFPDGHQTRVTQHAQIGQAPQDGGSSASLGQVDDPDHHMVPLRIQSTTRSTGSGGAPHDLANGVALLREGAECRVGNARLGIGCRKRGRASGAGATRPTSRHGTAPEPFAAGGTTWRAVGRVGARRRAHAFHGHHGTPG